MHHLFITLCIYIVYAITINDGLLESHFQGLQEMENVQISHKPIHRLKRQVSTKNASTPDVILTVIKGDNHQSILTFRRNREKKLSPLHIVNIDAKLVKERKDKNHCTHIYEDIKNSAHALVDRCRGTNHVTMISEVVIKNEMYLILPKDPDKTDDTPKHSLYKVNVSRNFENDYKWPEMGPMKENLVPNFNDRFRRLPNFNDRFRRATERTFVELMIVIDFSLYTFWRQQTTGTETERDSETLDLIQNMYTFLGNGVNLRYQSMKTAYGLDIDVELTSIYVLKTAKESQFSENVDTSVFPRGQIDGEVLLSEFEKWINVQKVQTPATFLNKDHFMLLTAREIVLSGNADAAGYAYISKICTDKSMSIVEDKFNFISVVTAAHELGHSLGGLHDRDTGDSNCQDEYGFILSSINSVYIDSRATHPWKFSPCSANAFKSLIEKLKTTGNDCLREENTQAVLNPTGSPPGQIFPPDKQCKMMVDSDSVMWRQRHIDNWERLCTAMACSRLGLTNVTYVIPGDGTTCGNKKWCMDGKCVTSANAPEADESCLHGDQPGNFISGTTCAATLAGGQFWKCYQANIEKPCCASCSPGVTNIEGCKYGDVSDCSKIISRQCYKEDISDSQCCKTCHNFAQPYVNLPTACKYGDKRTNCDSSDSTCSSFLSECCSTCNGYTGVTQSKPPTSVKSSVEPVTSKKTTPEVTTIEKPVENKEDEGLPSWVLPVAAGAGGAIVLSILIGVCSYCMKQNASKNKYRDDGHRHNSNGRHRHRSSDDRSEHRRRHRSDDGRRRSDERRSESDDRRRRSDENRRDHRRDRRRGSEDSRGGYRNYDRKPSITSGNSRY